MQDELILNYLRENRGKSSSGEDISKKLKISRTAVWKHIQGLRKLGYEINAETNRGYQLVSIPDKLYKDEIAYGLGTELLGKKTILCFDSLDSTNSTCFALGEKGLEEGACVFSEFQKKGRGRLGREWQSQKGKNILMSVLLRPLMSPTQVSRMTLLAAVSLVKTFRKFGAEVAIKWPNDILYKEMKVCGILTEMSAETDKVNFVVVGIGINVNSVSSELPPNSASLRSITGKEVQRADFARYFLGQFEKDYLEQKKGNFKAMVNDWEAFSATSGQRVRVEALGRKVEGQAMGIDEDGALWVRRDDGLQERITAGDVHHLRPVNA